MASPRMPSSSAILPRSGSGKAVTARSYPALFLFQQLAQALLCFVARRVVEARGRRQILPQRLFSAVELEAGEDSGPADLVERRDVFGVEGEDLVEGAEGFVVLMRLLREPAQPRQGEDAGGIVLRALHRLTQRLARRAVLLLTVAEVAAGERAEGGVVPGQLGGLEACLGRAAADEAWRHLVVADEVEPGVVAGGIEGQRGLELVADVPADEGQADGIRRLLRLDHVAPGQQIVELGGPRGTRHGSFQQGGGRRRIAPF